MKLWKRGLALTLAVLMTGCAGSTSYQKAKDDEAVGHWDMAVMNYAKALELNPENAGYKAALARAKLKASQVHFERGKMYRASGRPDLAIVELSQTVLLDPTNDYAKTELRKSDAEYAKQQEERFSETKIEGLKKKTKGVRASLPMLEPSSDRPINLNFPQPKPIKQIYRALADAAGINVVFDPQLKDDNVSIVLTQVAFQKALETLLRQENHFYKIIDEHTILIAADTPQNRKTYEDLVIKTFFLSNADVTEVANALRALLQTTRISVNKAENSITLRDTSDKVAVAERIVEQNDKQVAEVVVDVELLQINATKAQNLGIQLVPRAVGATIPSPGTGVTNLGATISNGFTWDQLKQIGINSFGFTIPSVVLTFIKDNTDAELLAKPQLRIAEGQKAQLLIGDRVPDPGLELQYVERLGLERRADHLVPVPGRRHQDRGRAARAPQPRGHPQADDRSVEHLRICRGQRTERLGAPADHRDTHDLLEYPPARRGDQLPRRPVPDGQDERPRDHPFPRRHPRDRAHLLEGQDGRPDDGPRSDAHTPHHPDPRRDRRGPDARLRRHGRQHLLSGRSARREPAAGPGPVRGPARTRPAAAAAHAAARGAAAHAATGHQSRARQPPDRHLPAAHAAAAAAARVPNPSPKEQVPQSKNSLAPSDGQAASAASSAWWPSTTGRRSFSTSTRRT